MNILTIASYIGAIGVVIGFLYKLYNIAISIDKLIKGWEENTLLTLKLLILNEDLPIQERISYGERYLALGGNGYIKKIYEHLLDEVEKDLNKE